MEVSAVVGKVRRIASVRADEGAGPAELESALRSLGELQSWLAGTKAALTSKLAANVSFPEQTIADCTRDSTREAIRDTERAATLESAPGLADALDDARVTAGHVDELTRATKSLDDEQRRELFDRIEDRGLLDVAAAATVEAWRRRLAQEVRSLQRDDGLDRLERQRRGTRVRSWVDGDGMWCLSGRFDPVTGVGLSAKLDAAVNALFATTTPETCPGDPIEKQRHLTGLALAALIEGRGGGRRSGAPEFVVVVDTSSSDGAGGPATDWGVPVEIPHRVLADMMSDAAVHAVVVRNGVILHAPGDTDLGRTTRLANRAQRRALRALYSSCAIPGCSVRYDRCKLHHVVWWRHGGRTDLANLLPLCTQHHTKVHDAGWLLELGANRELTVRFPDGTVRNTGPPSRRAA